MCVACVESLTDARPAAAGETPLAMTPMTEEEDRYAERRRIYREELAAGIREHCRQCGCCYRPADSDGAITRRLFCCSCETEWVERSILIPLVEALGRRGARKALRGLVKKCAK